MLKVVGASWFQTRISSYILGVICVLSIMALFLAEMERAEDDGNYAATVYWTKKSGFKIEFWGQGNDLEDIPKGAARAYYRADMASTGWSQLEIETEPSNPDWVQAYAAGLLEGALTWQLIHWHWTNTIEYQCNKAPESCALLRKTLDESIATVRKKATKLDKRDSFWHHVHLFYTHIDGISTGWNYGVERSRNEHEIDMVDFIWMNSVSEIPHIARSLNITLDSMLDGDKPGMASAFVRLVQRELDGKKQQKIYMAHNSAGSYNSMLRLVKRYKLNYHQTSDPNSPLVPGISSVFTGYPAAVSSHDEMYIITGSDDSNHKLAVTGTNFNNFNDDLYSELDLAAKVPIGPRVSAANRLATDGRTWAQILAHSNSGTALKQWVVVDFTKLSRETVPISKPKPKTSTQDNVIKIVTSELDSEEKDVNHTVVHTFVHGEKETNNATGLLWVIEQIPGLTHAVDETRSLYSRGYWASFGIPYIQDIAELTATFEMEKKFGQRFSVQASPKALLFNYGSKKATSIDSLIRLMRSNHFTTEIFSNKVINATVGLSNGEATDTYTAPNGTNGVSQNNNNDKLTMIDTLVNKCSWHGVGVRGDIAGTIHEDSIPVGVIDTKILSGTAEKIDNFQTISGPTFSNQYKTLLTKLKREAIQLNKGNLAATALKEEDEEELEEELFDTIENALSPTVQCANNEKQLSTTTKIMPFKWSASQFASTPHIGHPDLWDFEPLKPVWVW